MSAAWIVFPILLPIVAGLYLLLPLQRGFFGDESAVSLRRLHLLVLLVLLAAAVSAFAVVWGGAEEFSGFTLFFGHPIYFRIDGVAKLYVSLISLVWVLVGFYAVSYMHHEVRERRFFAFYLMTYGVLVGLSCAGNLVTLYVFYELMTLSTMPLVFHSQTHEAIMASLKYLFYSMFGAYCVLFCIFILNRYCISLNFTAGGTLDMNLLSGHEGLLLLAVFVLLLGFGVKAGMFPMHAWLPSAHPVAPAAASAVLSGIIVKGGVLGIIRVVFYIVGADFIRGSWVQTTWTILALITVFLGSMLAYREPVLKKRLAYSTVSQVSYILFGLSMLTEEALTGAMMQIVFHAIIKTALFLVAGILIFQTDHTRVKDFVGIGKKMPVTLWCFTFLALGLIGIPPTCGFIGKWHLAVGGLTNGPIGYVGAAVLLVSALLTAGYLLPITTKGFFPGRDGSALSQEQNAAVVESVQNEAAEEADEGCTCVGEPSLFMLLPVVILAVLCVMLGIFPSLLSDFVTPIAAALL